MTGNWQYTGFDDNPEYNTPKQQIEYLESNNEHLYNVNMRLEKQLFQYKKFSAFTFFSGFVLGSIRHLKRKSF